MITANGRRKWRIVHALEGKTWSGGQQQALFLCREQMRLGHQVVLACQRDSVLAERARALGIEVRGLPFRREVDPQTLLGLSRLLTDFAPDVVNVHRAWAHTMALLVSLWRGFHGLVVTRRVAFRPSTNPPSRAKYCSAGIRGYIAVSHGVAARLREVGVRPAKIRVVHPATDTERFDPSQRYALPAALQAVAGRPLLLLVGNYHRNKGHEVAIEAFANLASRWPEAVLVLAGRGTDGPELAEATHRTGLQNRIVRLGFSDEVPALLQHSAISINASFEEGFAGTLRESLAMGVPAVASAIPANCELLQQAFPDALFAPGDARSLAAAIERWRPRYPDAAWRARLREEVTANYAVGVMVARTLQAYSLLLRHPRG